MLHPSYTDLMKVINSGVEHGEEPTVNSRYSVVIAASKRARQLIDEQQDEEEKDSCFKPLSVAVDELNSGEVKILGEDECPEDEINPDMDEEIVLEEDVDSEEAEDAGAEE